MSIAKCKPAVGINLAIFAGQARKALAAMLIGAMAAVATSEHLVAGALSDKDFEDISQIGQSFRAVTTGLAEALQSPNVVPAEAECTKNTLQDLAQAGNELSKYEYLIVIEKQVRDSGDDDAMKDVVKFAVGKALEILNAERRHMTQLADQCTRFAMYAAHNKRAVQFIDNTTTKLQSILARL